MIGLRTGIVVIAGVAVGAGALTSAAAAVQIRPQRRPAVAGTFTVKSIGVKNNVISLIGTNGRSVRLPDGTFKSGDGVSIVVQTWSPSSVAGIR